MGVKYIVSQHVVDFYKMIETKHLNSQQTVSIDIPLEYMDAVKELLIKLTNRNLDDAPHNTEPSDDLVSAHPHLDHLVVVYKNQACIALCDTSVLILWHNHKINKIQTGKREEFELIFNRNIAKIY